MAAMVFLSRRRRGDSEDSSFTVNSKAAERGAVPAGEPRPGRPAEEDIFDPRPLTEFALLGPVAVLVDDVVMGLDGGDLKTRELIGTAGGGKVKPPGTAASR